MRIDKAVDDSLTRFVWSSLLVIFASIIPVSCDAAEIDFLVPGVSLRSVEFIEGASVTYLIISEAHGIADSSLVSLSVISSGPEGSRLSIRSTTWPPVDTETVEVRLTICSNAAETCFPEELYSCISNIEIKNGTEPFREPAPEELEDFDIERLFIERRGEFTRRELERDSVDVPAGSFICDVREYSRSEVRDVAMGGITAKRSEEETSTLHISSEVPFWGLVRSRVERRSQTSYPGGRNQRETRPRETVTESVLVEYGIQADSPGN
jgi:hypothetical protein